MKLAVVNCCIDTPVYKLKLFSWQKKMLLAGVLNRKYGKKLLRYWEFLLLVNNIVLKWKKKTGKGKSSLEKGLGTDYCMQVGGRKLGSFIVVLSETKKAGTFLDRISL